MIIAAAGLLIYASSGPRESIGGQNTAGIIQNNATKGKVAAGTAQDGEHYVRVSSIQTNPEDSTVTLRLITYFEGVEARASAVAEVKCDGAIETCVPTLQDGYYVRESGAPMITVPFTASTKINLANKYNATIADLIVSTKDAATPPVFIVTIKDGNLVQIAEKTVIQK